MNKKLFAILGLCLLISSQLSVVAQQNPEETGEEVEFNPNEGGMDENTQAQMARQMIVICIVMSKHQLNSYGNELSELVTKESNSQAQHQFYRKILAEHILECSKHIQPQQASEIIQELQERTFTVTKYGQYFSQITLEKYSQPGFDKNFSPEEEQILRMNDEMEQYWKEQQEQQEEDEEINSRQRLNPEDYEPKFFGISSKSFPSGFKFLYLLIVGGAIAGVIYIGYNKATEEERNISKKKDKKKSKKE